MNRYYVCLLSLFLLPACAPKKKEAAQPAKPEIAVQAPAPAAPELPAVVEPQPAAAQPEAFDDSEARAYQNDKMESELLQELAVK